MVIFLDNLKILWIWQVYLASIYSAFYPIINVIMRLWCVFGFVTSVWPSFFSSLLEITDFLSFSFAGKYATKQLISNLPQENRPKDVSDETLCAVLACLNEVLSSNVDHVK